MKYQSIALSLTLLISGCAIEVDRTGYSDAWYYERLAPYYENNLALRPRVYLRAVRELVGVPVTFDDGTEGHADVFRDDIELFFATPVINEEERLNLIRSAVGETCPSTDLEAIKERIAYFDETYVVLQNVPCRGFAT
ncbi:MAG: hypothetical protein P8Q92_09040 [Pseudoprimorskyibacter sp.]|nr:hypothetical protein [Pseudoprimorskyibacter sp.]